MKFGMMILMNVFRLTLFLMASLCTLHAQEAVEEGHCINFSDVSAIEFIRFVSKISGKNFIYDPNDLSFSISLSTGTSLPPEKIVEALVQLLKVHGLKVSEEEGYYVIHTQETPTTPLPPEQKRESYEFSVYKLQYHEGPEIEEALKKVGSDLRSQQDAPVKLINAIQSIQWVRATNSLLFSADKETIEKLHQLVASLDIPLRQVFIEVLVIETDVKKSMDFGLQWAAGGKYGHALGGGAGLMAPHSNFGSTMQGINASQTPSGLNQIPLLPGFDLGVIGDVITHRGTSYLSLGALVSALQLDHTSTIVLNQKIITQDNKNSTIFVGDNIPFTGSIVQTVGQSQQTTSNVEYRDIGVSLSITPRLGEGDIITLSLNEEITESMESEFINRPAQVNGIRTTKTNMATHVHVPDQHFLVLSGMIRNTKVRHKAGLPCLGGLPYIGSAFSHTHNDDEKRNVIIFVRPHIIHSFQDYTQVTQHQEEVHRKQAVSEDFNAALLEQK